MTIVAAVDCGTNAIRLLIVERQADHTLRDISRRMEIVRLGAGVDTDGQFQPEAIERTRAVLHEYVAEMQAAGVRRVRMVATSATRDAANRDDFFEMTKKELGVAFPGAVAEVISGQEEARLSFSGAVSDCDAKEGPFVVMDLGGGSTELVIGDKDQADGAVSAVMGAMSLNIGCVRLTERCLRSTPPTEEEITAARAVAAEYLDKAFNRLPVEDAITWVGLAGTFTTVAALALGLTEYDPQAIHHTRLSLDRLDEITDDLLHSTLEERLQYGAMHPGRADVIGGGCIVIQEIVRHLREQTTVDSIMISERDILDGLVHDLLHRRS